MQWDKSLAAGDKVEQGLFLLLADLADVGIDDQAVVGGELFRVEVFNPPGVLDINSPGAQYRDQLCGPFERLMMSPVAEKESRDAFFSSTANGGGKGSEAEKKGRQKLVFHVPGSRGWGI